MRRARKGFSILATLCLLAGLALAAPEGAAERSAALTISAGALGQTWYMLAALLGEALKKEYAGTRITVMAGGGVANVSLLDQGTIDFGFTSTDLHVAALRGVAPYKKRHPDVLGVANIQALSPFYFMVETKTGLNSIEEWVQKKTPLRICTFKKAGPPAVSMLRLFEEYGIGEKDIVAWGGKINFMTWQDCVALARDGHVDALVGGTGMPSPFHTEVASVRKVKLLPVPAPIVKRMQEKHGYIPVTIPKGTYGVVEEDLPVFGWTGYILTRRQTPEKAVYDLTRLLHESAPRIRRLHAAFRRFDPALMPTDIPGPLHPGAARLYKEKGLLN